MHRASARVREKVFDWKRELYEERYNLLISFLFLIAAGALDFVSSNYAARKGEAIATDIILDFIPPINLSFLFVYGSLIIVFALFLYPLFYDFKKLPTAIFHFSLLSMVRSAFIAMTHLKTPLDAIPAQFPWPFGFINYPNDLFFSGHTALPLVGFFVFRDSKIRYFFLASSVIMAITVLAMHKHYTIDVASAFFIAYGTYHLGKRIFDKLRTIGRSPNRTFGF